MPGGRSAWREDTVHDQFPFTPLSGTALLHRPLPALPPAPPAPSVPLAPAALAGRPPEAWPGLDWGDQGLQRLAKLRQLRDAGRRPLSAPLSAARPPPAEALAAYEPGKPRTPTRPPTSSASPLAVPPGRARAGRGASWASWPSSTSATTPGASNSISTQGADRPRRSTMTPSSAWWTWAIISGPRAPAAHQDGRDQPLCRSAGGC